MSDRELTPQEKIAAGNSMVDSIFWKRVMVPTIDAQMAILYGDLAECPLKDVNRVRADLKALDMVKGMPQMIIENARQTMELDEFQREQSGDEGGEGSAE